RAGEGSECNGCHARPRPSQRAHPSGHCHRSTGWLIDERYRRDRNHLLAAGTWPARGGVYSGEGLPGGSGDRAAWRRRLHPGQFAGRSVLRLPRSADQASPGNVSSVTQAAAAPTARASSASARPLRRESVTLGAARRLAANRLALVSLVFLLVVVVAAV